MRAREHPCVSPVLVTGAAGFVGAHLCAGLARRGHRVIGCDHFGGGRDARLKHQRVSDLLAPAGVTCVRMDVTDVAAVESWLGHHRPDTVVHLAAHAGVRRSIEHPMDYLQANVVGFANVLEACRRHGVGHLLYASSSSVYGARDAVPFRESDGGLVPASPYAATKLANEAMAQGYAQVYPMRLTGMRFFTLYGPWGRPDMAYFLFAQRLRRGQPITLFGDGQPRRDFTYIGDAVHAVTRLCELPPAPGAPRGQVLNIGHRRPVRMTEFVRALERATGWTARIEPAPLPPGDVPVTCADDTQLRQLIGDWPCTGLDDGLGAFARWFRAWADAEDELHLRVD